MHISSGFGVSDSAHVDHTHKGLDFAMPQGSPIHALHSGVVTKVSHDGGFGNAVWMKFPDGYTAVYGHMNEVFVKARSKVRDQDIIGTVGSTGHSTGPHLHLGIMDNHGQWIDPNAYIHPQVVVNVGGHPIHHSLTPDQWKDQVETWGQQLFGIPKGVWNAGTPHAHVIDPQNAFTQALIQLFEGLGKALLHVGPSILLVVCCGSILGAMIGSMRCRHWAGVSALGTIVCKVMDNYVGG